MSKPMLFICLLIAVAVHWALLTGNAWSARQETAAATIAFRELAAVEPTVESTAAPPENATAPDIPHPPPQKAAPPPQPAPEPSSRQDRQPTLARTASPQRVNIDSPGDFSGTADANQRATLRIDWGSPEEAIAIVATGGMRLVVLSPEGGISAEIVPRSNQWHRIEFEHPDLSRFSNRVRIVDSTPAFIQAAALRNNGERIAVLLPLSLEHTLRSQQIRTAAEAGLESSGIRAFYGRFRIDSGRVIFDISGFERRST